jgi:hypothetical protein
VVSGRAASSVAKHGAARALRASEAVWSDTSPEENAGGGRTKRPKRVTRREASHFHAPNSARGVEVISRVLIFDKLGLHVLDRRTLLRRLRQGLRRGTPRPRSLALAGARDEGLATGAARRPRVRFESGPGATALIRDAIQRTRRSSGAFPRRPRKPAPAARPGISGQSPLRRMSPRQQVECEPRGARKPAGASEMGTNGTSFLSRRRRRFATRSPRRTVRPNRSWRALDCAASAPDRAGANLAGPSSGTRSVADGASFSGSRSR